MSDHDAPGDSSLDTDQGTRIDAVCDRFEAAWQAGRRPRIEDYLAEVLEANRPLLIRELVEVEIDWRRRAGDTLAADEYLSRFPDLDRHWLDSLVHHTVIPTSPKSATPSNGAFSGRRAKRIRCPHCHNPISLIDDKSDEVLCPGCGSSFTVRDARHTDTTSGSRPLGKYQLLERVGLGAFGAVWKARDTQLDRIVALKIPHSGLMTNDAELQRFHREARAAAQLRHPGIVTVYDVETLEGLPTIVSDFIAGAPLRDLLQTRRVTFREAASLIADIADAVHYAHTMNVVHRDLKPANILMSFSRERQASEAALTDGSRLNDVTPLIADFGLALRNEAEVTMTMDGHIIGTPAYMSPEQAAGKSHAADARSDVYSLGVIFYELLTGELPFRGSRVMMIQQVMHEEARPPRKLNDKVPRDLETMCLKCLRKEPGRRYQAARELAEDSRRWLKGEPVHARPVGSVERAVRWARRRPGLVGALASGVLLASALVVTVLWWHGERTALEAAAVASLEADLNESERLRDRGEFDASAAVLRRAKDRLREFVPPELGNRLSTAFDNLELVMRLDKIRLNQAPLGGGHLNKAAIDQEYQAAFRDAQLADRQADPDEVAVRIRASDVRRSIVAALDDWAACARDPARQAWCLYVAKRADTDADEWCHRVRDPKAWQDSSALAELAATAHVKAQSLSLLLALGLRLEELGGNAASLYQRILTEHPEDFSTNVRLGNAMVKRDPKEAVGYFRAALAVRPNAIVAANNLAVALRAAGRLDEAIACYERALRLDPGYAPAHNNLGLVLRDKGKLDEARASFERAIEVDPKFLGAYVNLGNVLRRKGEVARAIECYQGAARLGHGDARPHYSLGLIMQDQGRIDDAIEHYQNAVQLDPRMFQAHCNLGQLLTDQGRLDEAIDHLQAAVTIEPGDNLSHKHLARALQQKGFPDKALVHLFQSHYLKKEYLAAARLSADTFTGDPKLADDLDAGHRYRGARAAAVAGCGGGADGAELDEAERARWRRQARDWLRLDLAAWTNRLETAKPTDRVEVQKVLARWRDEPDLSGLREPDALEKLPPAERQECQALWQDVAAVLRRADTVR